ncbi:hypothetical protein [Helicobacter rodentium]|uniref:hypothetical protein n=2 Tax=Helicobacter rodentium TaxID=59617 RepID=UPI0023F0B6DE|nr:hypothetical protein [Helicobacter rodentium]
MLPYAKNFLNCPCIIAGILITIAQSLLVAFCKTSSHLPPNKTSCNIPLKVWGSGFIMPPSGAQETLTRPLEVHAVRGFKTKERLEHIFQTKLTGIALGDPGLLASALINANKTPKKYEVGIIPHYIEKKS